MQTRLELPSRWRGRPAGKPVTCGEASGAVLVLGVDGANILAALDGFCKPAAWGILNVRRLNIECRIEHFLVLYDGRWTKTAARGCILPGCARVAG